VEVLFVAAEAAPLVKTGGLGDVMGSLPSALAAQGHDARLVLPAYQQILDQTDPVRVGEARWNGLRADILATTFPGTRLTLYLVDSPPHFRRPGGPYGDQGVDWDDNAQRFAMFAHSVVAMALGQAGLDWRPQVVHCHDWHTGLVPALLSNQPARPRTVFTVHNMAYQGLFPHQTFLDLGLPERLWSVDGAEFHGQLSYLKSGLACADLISTVSPTYAEEICTPEHGCGLDGLLRDRREQLFGILNGADYEVWDPSKDPHIAHHFSAERPEAKVENKASLQADLGLERDASVPVLAFVARLVEQKGVDLLLAALPELMQRRVQVAVVGQGERGLERALRGAASRYPGRLGVHVGYTEELAHRAGAAADMALLPSRFEPCGLTQLYSMRYGAVPIVRRTGGLSDTVTDASTLNLVRGTATGFQFHDPCHRELMRTVDRALSCYARPPLWRRLVQAGMTRQFDWTSSATEYVGLYHTATAS
jgi:starch synthase